MKSILMLLALAASTEACSDAGAGMNVGWINAGKWLAYDIYVTSIGAEARGYYRLAFLAD
ncbi:hypothetical protein [Luteolibacter soli]|uniref:Uncharacterized protein n=1 Tax=Luteolibacter soli TaxID=3135280 RepID=A0ABU9B0X1_9BACT